MKLVAMAVTLMTGTWAAQAQLPGTDVGIIMNRIIDVVKILEPFIEAQRTAQRTALFLAFVLPSIFLVVPCLYWLFASIAKRRST